MRAWSAAAIMSIHVGGCASSAPHTPPICPPSATAEALPRPTPGDGTLLTLDSAILDRVAGRYGAALRKHIWILDHGIWLEPESIGVVAVELPRELVYLSGHFAPAFVELRDRERRLQERLRGQNDVGGAEVLLYVRLTEALDREVELLETYRALSRRNAAGRSAMLRLIAERLIAEKRWADLAAAKDVALEMVTESARSPGAEPEQRLLALASGVVDAVIQTNSPTEAAQFARSVAEAAPTPRMYATLIVLARLRSSGKGLGEELSASAAEHLSADGQKELFTLIRE